MKKQALVILLVHVVCVTAGIVIGCNINTKQITPQASIDDDNYLDYMGLEKGTFSQYSEIKIYEDRVHNKVIYAGYDTMNYTTSIAVTDIKNVDNNK